MTVRRKILLGLLVGFLSACSHTTSKGPQSEPMVRGETQSLVIGVRGGFIREGTQDLNGCFYAFPAPLRVPDGRYEATVRLISAESDDLRLTVGEPAVVTTLHAVYRL
jgi:hypothetical protein